MNALNAPSDGKWAGAARVMCRRAKTPFYLFREDKVVRNIEMLSESLQIQGRDSRIIYSVKTNPSKEVLRLVFRAGWGALISSRGDLDRIANHDVGKVFLDSPVKSPEEIAWGLSSKVSSFVFENMADIAKVTSNPSARTYLHQVGCGVRISVPISVSARTSRFGFDLNAIPLHAVLESLGGLSNKHPVRSLHFHLGLEYVQPNHFSALAQFAGSTWRLFAQNGVSIRELSMGGGLPAGLSRGDAQLFSSAVGDALKAENIPLAVGVVWEPGRSVVENAGALCVTVLDICERHGITYALVDGGSNLVMPAWMASKSRKVTCVRMSAHPTFRCKSMVRVVGPLCAENDQLADVLFPNGVSIGDVLIVLNTGAYDWSTKYSFGEELPHSHWFGEHRVSGETNPSATLKAHRSWLRSCG